jgi:hypothetical protein
LSTIRELEVEVSTHKHFKYVEGLLVYPDYKPEQLVRVRKDSPKGWVVDSSDPISKAYLCALVGLKLTDDTHLVLSRLLEVLSTT